MVERRKPIKILGYSTSSTLLQNSILQYNSPLRVIPAELYSETIYVHCGFVVVVVVAALPPLGPQSPALKLEGFPNRALIT